MTLDHVLFFAAGACVGLWLGELRVSSVLRRMQFGTAPGSAGEPRRMIDEEYEARTAIAPPIEIVTPEAIERGEQQLLAMAQAEGRELSRAEARHQAKIMLMQESGLIAD